MSWESCLFIPASDGVICADSVLNRLPRSRLAVYEHETHNGRCVIYCLRLRMWGIPVTGGILSIFVSILIFEMIGGSIRWNRSQSSRIDRPGIEMPRESGDARVKVFPKITDW